VLAGVARAAPVELVEHREAHPLFHDSGKPLELLGLPRGIECADFPEVDRCAGRLARRDRPAARGVGPRLRAGLVDLDLVDPCVAAGRRRDIDPHVSGLPRGKVETRGGANGAVVLDQRVPTRIIRSLGILRGEEDANPRRRPVVVVRGMLAAQAHPADLVHRPQVDLGPRRLAAGDPACRVVVPAVVEMLRLVDRVAAQRRGCARPRVRQQRKVPCALVVHRGHRFRPGRRVQQRAFIRHPGRAVLDVPVPRELVAVDPADRAEAQPEPVLFPQLPREVGHGPQPLRVP